MKIVQIKGANGSGKTTIVKDLIAYSQDTELLVKNNRVYATVMNDLGWAAVGKYPRDAKMGGCDCMPDILSIKTAIHDIMQAKPGYWVVFEGMMISTIRSTFYDYLLGLPGIEPLFIILLASPECCMERIAGRGTMKPGLKLENIAAKCFTVVHGADTYDQQYVRYIDVDTTPRDQMLRTFLYAVEDTEALSALELA